MLQEFCATYTFSCIICYDDVPINGVLGITTNGVADTEKLYCAACYRRMTNGDYFKRSVKYWFENFPPTTRNDIDDLFNLLKSYKSSDEMSFQGKFKKEYERITNGSHDDYVDMNINF